MNSLRKQYISVCLAILLIMFCYAFIANAQETTTMFENDAKGVVAADDGYDPQKLKPTWYPANLEDLRFYEEIKKYSLKIWGEPYLFAEDQIFFSLINNTDEDLHMPGYTYELEVEINGHWYEIYCYKNIGMAASSMNPRSYGFFAVDKTKCPKLYPGKHRIMFGGVCNEFEIVELGSSLPQKPRKYDWNFLQSPQLFSSALTLDKAHQDDLSIAKIEVKPIATFDQYIYYSIDNGYANALYWKALCLEAKTQSQLPVLIFVAQEGL